MTNVVSEREFKLKQLKQQLGLLHEKIMLTNRLIGDSIIPDDIQIRASKAQQLLKKRIEETKKAITQLIIAEDVEKLEEIEKELQL